MADFFPGPFLNLLFTLGPFNSQLNVYLAFRELYLWVKLSSLVLIWYLNVRACMISFFATRLVRTFVMVWEMLVEEIRRD